MPPIPPISGIRVLSVVAADKQLERLSQAEQMLATIARADEALQIANMAEAARVYAKKFHLGTAAENHAWTIRTLAEMRMAECVDEGQARGEIATNRDGGRPPEKCVLSPDTLPPATLTDLDIPRQRLHEARKLPALGEAAIRAEGAKATEEDRRASAAPLIRAAKLAEVIAALEDIGAKEAKAIQGVYDVIVIDPPWPMQKIESEASPTDVGFDYPTMSEAELAEWGKSEIPCADACHVWLWTTHKHLPAALRLLETWALKYVCTFVWHKPGGFQPFGLPQYNCEFALYAHRGAPVFADTKAFPVCFEAPRGRHSEKPEAFYEVLRRVTAGRRLDMFGRRAIEGFDSWGNEAPA